MSLNLIKILKNSLTPKITKVEVIVEVVPNELYAQNMEYRHQYDEILKHFGEGRLKEAGAIQKDLQLDNVNIYYTILINMPSGWTFEPYMIMNSMDQADD